VVRGNGICGNVPAGCFNREGFGVNSYHGAKVVLSEVAQSALVRAGGISRN
jgi:hypothetical protein